MAGRDDLCLTCANGEQTVKQLVAAGAAINADDGAGFSGGTAPLQCAIMSDHLQIVQWLVL